ncbi:hypothetical protein ElyMa_000233500 [Elysia marginata]|uniref:Secreted protein n=1 Tax=Elysia marginata TaxID=1093978 RepID=A0AAV4F0B9_9GAST|nr:hypothetical protein ElyMa_000233500 [Elysia marginata]
MATVIGDAKKMVILTYILLHGQCNNTARHCSAHGRIRDAFCRKRPGLFRTDFLCFSRIRRPRIQQTLHSNSRRITVGKFFNNYPAHSSHMASSEFHLLRAPF